MIILRSGKRYTPGVRFIIIGSLACVAALASSPYGRGRADDYITSVKKIRADRDREYRDPKQSPLEPGDITGFKGLSYFKITPGYRVRARFVRTPDEKKFGMPTTTGQTRVYLKYGELKFVVAGQARTLGVYQSESLSKTEKYKNHLLIPFTDLTNGKETYGGGRYIDFVIPTSEAVVLDFNLAYNPSCAYNPSYSCPIPPRQNHLDIKIKAGEKAYQKPHGGRRA
jgi:uncharacterized protein